MQKFTQNLIDAKALILNEQNWCRYSLHRDSGQRCALGALLRTHGGEDKRELVNYKRNLSFHKLEMSARKLFGFCIARVNDELGHSQVMDVYDDAICDQEMPETFDHTEGELT